MTVITLISQIRGSLKRMRKKKKATVKDYIYTLDHTRKQCKPDSNKILNIFCHIGDEEDPKTKQTWLLVSQSSECSMR